MCTYLKTIKPLNVTCIHNYDHDYIVILFFVFSDVINNFINRDTMTSSKQTTMLRELLTCSLCLEEMTKSRLLPCHHGYCLSCLQKHADSSMKDNKFTCPVCRAECTVPEGGVQHFSPNIFIHSLREALDSDAETTETDEKEVPPGSSTCDSDDCKEIAVYFCTAGCGFLCTKCEAYHGKIRISRNHIIIDAKDGGNKSKQLPFCTRHPNHMVELYCDRCSLPCCATCVVLYHQSHKCCELTTKEISFKTKVEDVLVKIDQYLEVTEAAITSTEQQEKQMETDVDDLITLNASTFNKLRKQLTDKEQSINKNIMQCRPYARKQIIEVKERQQMIKVIMESAKRYGNEMLQKATPYDFATNTDSFAEHVDKKLSPTPAVYAWNCILGTADKAKFATGSIDLDEAKALTGEKIQWMLTFNDTINLSGRRPKRLKLVMNGDVLLSTTENNRQMIYAHSIAGKELNKIDVGFYIFDMDVYSCDNDSCQIIIVGDGRLCHVDIKRDKFTMKKTSTDSPGWKMTSVSVNKDHNIFVSSSDRPTYIRIVKKPCSHIKDISLTNDMKAQEPISDPHGNGYVFLEVSKTKLMWIDDKGQKIKESTESGIKRFICDGQGMFIAISNNYRNNLLLIDNNGATVAHLIPHDDKLDTPQALCLDKDKHMLCVSQSRGKEDIIIMEYPAYMKNAISGHSCAMTLRAKLPEP